jgi:hypothetical protein
MATTLAWIAEKNELSGRIFVVLAKLTSRTSASVPGTCGSDSAVFSSAAVTVPASNSTENSARTASLTAALPCAAS